MERETEHDRKKEVMEQWKWQSGNLGMLRGEVDERTSGKVNLIGQQGHKLTNKKTNSSSKKLHMTAGSLSIT